jgi:hypothetical protein
MTTVRVMEAEYQPALDKKEHYGCFEVKCDGLRLGFQIPPNALPFKIVSRQVPDGLEVEPRQNYSNGAS